MRSINLIRRFAQDMFTYPNIPEPKTNSLAFVLLSVSSLHFSLECSIKMSYSVRSSSNNQNLDDKFEHTKNTKESQMWNLLQSNFIDQHFNLTAVLPPV